MRYNVILRGTVLAKHERKYEKTGTTYYNVAFDTPEGTEQLSIDEVTYALVQIGKECDYIAQVNTQPMYNGRMGSVLRIVGVNDPGIARNPAGSKVS